MYLGIDLGTSAIKSVLVDEKGQTAASASCELDLASPNPGWSEQAPTDWWEALLKTMEKLRASHPKQWQQVRAMGLSGQMHGAVLLDRNKQPLRNAILWNDGRSFDQCKSLLSDFPDVGQIAGVPPMPGFTAPKVMWVAENEPNIHERISHILLPKDYLRLRLTGELATDMADAAGTMWLDQASRSWSPAMCEHTSTRMEWLPRCVEGTQPAGQLTPVLAAQFGLTNGIRVAGGGGDAAAGAVGIGAINDGDAFISLGTSGQLFVANKSYRPRPEAAIHAYAHCVPGRWFQMAAMLNGASPMKWFADIAKQEISTLLDAAQAETTDRVPLFLPYLTGERTPHNDPAIRASFYRLDGKTTQASMMRSVVDAIAYSFCDARDALAAAGTQLDCVAAIGGGARSDFVLQTLSNALYLPIIRYQDADSGPAFGAARLAMVASGDFKIEDVALTPKPVRRFEPVASEEAYHLDRLSTYRALYEALKPLS